MVKKKVTYGDVTKRMKKLKITGVSRKVSPEEHMAHLDTIEDIMKRRKEAR